MFGGLIKKSTITSLPKNLMDRGFGKFKAVIREFSLTLFCMPSSIIFSYLMRHSNQFADLLLIIYFLLLITFYIFHGVFVYLLRISRIIRSSILFGQRILTDYTEFVTNDEGFRCIAFP